MSKIILLLICLQPILSKTSLRQLRHVVFALLCNPTQATMLSLSRWTEKGGSYWTIQRLYRTPMDWLQVHCLVMKTHLVQSDRVYLLAGDEVVMSKSGKKTHGVGRFFSSIVQLSNSLLFCEEFPCGDFVLNLQTWYYDKLIKYNFLRL